MSDDTLDAAYRSTHYRVRLPDGRTARIRLDAPNPWMRAYLAAPDTTWAYLTACNPGSKVLPAPENKLRQRALADRLIAADYDFHAGVGEGCPPGAWPAEPSYWVIGIDRAATEALASHCEQVAYLFGRSSGAATLCYTGAQDETA